MLKLQSPQEIKKAINKRARADKVYKSNSHVQKRYFSLMLVPSYSSAKTRSIRIPYVAFYILFFILAVVGITILSLYIRTQFLVRVAEHTSVSLEQAQEAYVNLQETSVEESRRLAKERAYLQAALTRERIRGQEEQSMQQQTYLDSLEILQSYVENLENQLTQFEIYRQEILDILSSRANIPPIRDMLNEMYLAQMILQDDLQHISNQTAGIRLEQGSTIAFMSATNNRVAASVSDQATDALLDYIALIELTLEIKTELYSQLEEQVRQIYPYLNNYPTLRPINGKMSSGFGWRRNPMGGGGGQMHRGVDISAPRGTSIVATGGGTVVFSDWSGAYGNKVIIDHGIGIKTLYAHNSQNLVQVGQTVSRGDVIARVGSTGQSTGPHVHYEVIVNGENVNPTAFFLE